MCKVVYIRSTNIYDDSRATKEILALLEAGYFIHVLGWNRDGSAKEKTHKVFQKYENQIKCSFFNVTLESGIGLKNIHILFRWIKWIKLQIKKEHNIRAIHMCNLDCTIGLNSYCKKNNIRTIYDIYDYYIDSHNIPKLLKGTVEKLEINAINKSDITIICTEERKEQIAKAKPKKLIVIHNSPSIKQNLKDVVKYDYVYCGSLTEKRLIKEILNNYSNFSFLKFAIAGYAKFANKAKELSEKYDGFDFFGAIPYEEVLKLESESLVISAIYEPTCRNHRLCAPNKFYEAMALEKPVIVCKGTGIDKIVKKNNIGMVINYNSDEFYNAIIELKNKPELCKEMGRNARKLYEEKYRWEIMKERLLEAYNELINCIGE